MQAYEEKSFLNKYWLGLLTAVLLIVLIVAWRTIPSYLANKEMEVHRANIVKDLQGAVTRLKRSNGSNCYSIPEDSFHKRGEGQDIEIAPKDVGLQTFDELKVLNKACEVRRLKAAFEDVLETKPDCRDIWRCEDQLTLFRKHFDKYMADFAVGLDDVSFADIGMTMANAKTRGDQVLILFAENYKRQLAIYPSNEDYYYRSPGVLTVHAIELYKQVRPMTPELLEELDGLEEAAYARRIDHMLRLLEVGVDYPESEEIAKRIREFVKDSYIPLAKFNGMTEARLEELTGRNPIAPRGIVVTK
ncbi:MAG: hypothetical protein NT003_04070 [Candidatus Magasanikbacteria bacterium]|nr:hypothetical protein [Candidatus Magasanikbacteria bacterium]